MLPDLSLPSLSLSPDPGASFFHMVLGTCFFDVFETRPVLRHVREMIELAAALMSLVAGMMLAFECVTRKSDTGTGLWLAVAAVLALQRSLAHWGAAAALDAAREGALLAGLALVGAGRPQGLRSLSWLALPALGAGHSLLGLPLLGLWLAARREFHFDSLSPFARFSAVYADRVAAVCPRVASTAQRDLVLARAFAALPPAARAPFQGGHPEPFPLEFLGAFLVFYCASDLLPPAATALGYGLTYLRVATA